MNQRYDENVWYRQPMVWLVIAIPLSSVILGVIMIVLAVSTSDGLVADDYYKQGLEINRKLERESRAHELALSAVVEIAAGDNRVSVELAGEPAFEAPQHFKLGFYHATRQGEDVVRTMRRDAQGVYSAPAPELAAGRWYVSAETPDWRLTRAINVPVEGRFTIVHRPPPRAGQGVEG